MWHTWQLAIAVYKGQFPSVHLGWRRLLGPVGTRVVSVILTIQFFLRLAKHSLSVKLTKPQFLDNPSPQKLNIWPSITSKTYITLLKSTNSNAIDLKFDLALREIGQRRLVRSYIMFNLGYICSSFLFIPETHLLIGMMARCKCLFWHACFVSDRKCCNFYAYFGRSSKILLCKNIRRRRSTCPDHQLLSMTSWSK